MLSSLRARLGAAFAVVPDQVDAAFRLVELVSRFFPLLALDREDHVDLLGPVKDRLVLGDDPRLSAAEAEAKRRFPEFERCV